MDDVLRCDGCGLSIEISDAVVNLAGRRLHRMCASSHREDTSGRPSGWLASLRGWVNLGQLPGR